QLEHHRLADERADEVERDGAGERVGRLQGQDDPRERPNEQRHGEPVASHAPHLHERQASPHRDVRDGAREIPYEMAETADGLDRVDGLSAEPFDHGPKVTSRVARCTLHEGPETKRPARSRTGRSCNVQPVTWNGAYAAKLASAFPTSPSRSRLSARSRSWRTRSRVTPSMPPISSSVCSRPPSNPKCRRTTFASRRCNVFSACSISSDRNRSIAWSSVSGRSSAMKRSISERSPSGSSGGASRTSPVLSAASDCTTSSDSLVASEISSGVGSRRSVCRRNSAVRTMRDRSAVRFKGTRTVRPWRASAARIAWRIHHTAYEMNFTPWSGSNFRAAVSRPTLPSPIRSVRGRPRFWYFLATEITK